MSIVIKYSSDDDKKKVIGILDKENIKYKVIDPIESIKTIESSEPKKSSYNDINEYDNDNPLDFYDLLEKITGDKSYDSDRINKVHYGNKNKDGIYYNKIYSSNPVELNQFKRMSYNDYLNKINELIEKVTKNNYNNYHPEKKMFEGKNPDGILYENLYGSDGKRHFDNFDTYTIYKSQLELGKKHEEAVNITKKEMKERKEKEMKEMKEMKEKEMKEKKLITKDQYDGHVPEKQTYFQKNGNNIDGIPFENLYIGGKRIYDYENYNNYRKEYLQKTSGGKRKTRRNRKSKKGKRSRKARKSRRKSSRRRRGRR